MKKLIRSALALLLTVSTSHAFSQGAVYINQEWQDGLGAPTFNPILNPFGYQWSNSIMSPSGEIITVGHTNVSGQGENVYLVKHDPDGNIMFQVDFNTGSTRNDYGIGLCMASNGDILICGATDNGGSTNYDMIIMRVNPSGSLVGSIVTRDKNGMNDFAVGIVEDPSGKITVAANAETGMGLFDYWAVKFDASLNFVVDNIYNFAGLQDIALGLEFTTGGNINLIGASFSGMTSCDYAIATFDPGLNFVSDKRNNLPGTALDQAIAFCKDASNNTYITGKAWNGTNFDIKTIKITSAFTIAWTTPTDVNGMDDVPSTIAVDASGNVIVGGYATNSNGTKEMFYTKYNSSGSVVWQHTLPGVNTSADAYIQKLVLNPTNGNIYFLATEQGATSLKQALVGKIKPNGERNWLKNIKNATNDIIPSDIKFDTDGIYAITILDPASAVYQTTKFSELELDTTSIFKNGDKFRVKNNILVRFQQSAVVASKINNRDMQHGKLSDFITSSALASLIEYSGLREIGYIPCYKVLPWMTMDDSMSVTRSGRTIKIMHHYTTLGLVLPGGSNDSLYTAKMLKAITVVNHAQYNHIFSLHATANDPYYTNGNSAGLTTNTTVPDANINIEPAWDLSVGDPNIKVGIFDTGINFTHQDFGNGTLAGSKIAGGYDYQANVPLSSITSNDVFGHGSAVADKIGALRNNNFGMAGIAGGDGLTNTGAKLFDMKIFGPGYACNFANTVPATEADVYNAIIQGAINNPTTGSGFIQNIQNHSWGGSPLYGLILDGFITGYQNEVVMVASAGNRGSATPCDWALDFPGSFKDNMVLKVGANDNTGNRAIFSFCGHRLDLIAPGTLDLYTSVSRTGNSFTDSLFFPPNPTVCNFQMNGTSFSAPHVAGTAALMLSYASNTFMPNGLYPEDVEQLMQLSAKDVTASPSVAGYDMQTGYGRLDAGQTLNNYYFPGYLVEHHTFSVSASSAVKVGGPFETTCLRNQMFGLPVGITKVQRYKISGTNSHSIPTGYNFVTGWERGAGSNLYSLNSSNASTVAIQCYTPGVAFFEDRYMPDGTNIIKLTVTPSSASFEGYIYKLLDSTGTQEMGWLPFDTTGTAVFAYSNYLRSQTLGIKEDAFTENSLYVFPNPTEGKIYFKSRLWEIDKIDVEVISSLGQVVFKQNNLYISESNSVDVSFLSPGIYFANLKYGKKSLVKKVIIAK